MVCHVYNFNITCHLPLLKAPIYFLFIPPIQLYGSSSSFVLNIVSKLNFILCFEEGGVDILHLTPATKYN